MYFQSLHIRSMSADNNNNQFSYIIARSGSGQTYYIKENKTRIFAARQYNKPLPSSQLHLAVLCT